MDWRAEKSGSEQASAARRRGGRWIWYVLLIPLVAGVLCLLGFGHHWRTEFDRRVEAIRATGLPVTLQELDAFYPWPQGVDNAANWVLSAATLYQKLPDEVDAKPLDRLISRGSDRAPPAEPLAAEIRKLLEQHLEANAKALETLHGAAAIPEARYPVDLARGFMAVMPHMAHLREAYRLLCWEAVLCADRGDPDAAAKALEAVVRVAGTVSREPATLSFMVQRSGAGWAAVVLERVLSRVDLSDEQLVRLEGVFRAAGGQESLLRALAGERCASIACLQKPQAMKRWPGDGLPPQAFLEVYYALGLAAREGAIYLDRMEECVRMAHLPPGQRLKALGTAGAQYRRSRGVLGRATGHPSGAMRRDVEESMRIDMARIMLAVERYRLAHGSVPGTLDQVVPVYLATIPEDPFSRAPLRYRRMDRGFVVYSVGEDGRDDGGKLEPPKQKKTAGETWDIPLRVER